MQIPRNILCHEALTQAEKAALGAAVTISQVRHCVRLANCILTTRVPKFHEQRTHWQTAASELVLREIGNARDVLSAHETADLNARLQSLTEPAEALLLWHRAKRTAQAAADRRLRHVATGKYQVSTAKAA
ncbi:hypothetical protein [Hymenobacter guriensis]|uniref:Four helix bundle protein n=1 Tax=Hymenobacter guriensis TaxID=2793065 RepID=A0ABS0KWT8_9BACT|nr:hypothetical protein [Hymenobacter guriensis]MBG8552322.1 hypothetical protein [Hymenobacter guriensis]